MTRASSASLLSAVPSPSAARVDPSFFFPSSFASRRPSQESRVSLSPTCLLRYRQNNKASLHSPCTYGASLLAVRLSFDLNLRRRPRWCRLPLFTDGPIGFFFPACSPPLDAAHALVCLEPSLSNHDTNNHSRRRAHRKEAEDLKRYPSGYARPRYRALLLRSTRQLFPSRLAATSLRCRPKHPYPLWGASASRPGTTTTHRVL